MLVNNEGAGPAKAQTGQRDVYPLHWKKNHISEPQARSRCEDGKNASQRQMTLSLVLLPNLMQRDPTTAAQLDPVDPPGQVGFTQNQRFEAEGGRCGTLALPPHGRRSWVRYGSRGRTFSLRLIGFPSVCPSFFLQSEHTVDG